MMFNMKPRALTKKQTAFRDAILSGFTPTMAYRKAFDAKGMSPKSISVNAQHLLKNKKMALAITLAVQSVLPSDKSVVCPPLGPRVRLTMEERLEAMEAAVRVDPADYFDELNHFMPIRQMPKHVRMAIAGFKVDPLSFVTEVKLVDRINATPLYSQLVGDIPRDKGPVLLPRRAQFDLTKLTDEELREHMRLRKKAMVSPMETIGHGDS
jgi:phage terminase small subunit